MDGSVVYAKLCQCDPMCFLGRTRVQIPNVISISSAVFAQLTAGRPYTLQRAAPFPHQNRSLHAGSETPSNAAAVAVVATSGERTRRKGRRGVICR